MVSSLMITLLILGFQSKLNKLEKKHNQVKNISCCHCDPTFWCTVSTVVGWLTHQCLPTLRSDQSVFALWNCSLQVDSLWELTDPRCPESEHMTSAGRSGPSFLDFWNKFKKSVKCCLHWLWNIHFPRSPLLTVFLWLFKYIWQATGWICPQPMAVPISSQQYSGFWFLLWALIFLSLKTEIQPGQVSNGRGFLCSCDL